MGIGHSKPTTAAGATASPLETITAISSISRAATTAVTSASSLSLSRATISSIAPEATSLLSTSSLSRASTSLVETTLTTSASVAAASPLAASATELTSSLSREITSTVSEEATSSLSRAITSTLSQASASPLAASAAAATQEAASATMSAISSASSSMASATATALGITGTGVGAGVASAPLAVISQPAKGPFTPVTAFLGTIPTKKLDVPITAVFLVLFAAGAANHFIRHELNSKRGHKFHLSDMVFDFCMVRVVTCTMRIVWAAKPQNNSIVLAALIFENAGVVVLFAVNVVLTQRVVRAIHPNFGWHAVTSLFFLAMLVSVPMIIIWNIVNTVVSFFTLNPKVLDTTHDLLLFGSCWTLYLSIFPLIFLIPATIIPCKTKVEKFGSGHFRVKIIFLVIISCMLAVGTFTRLIGNVEVFPTERPGNIDSKAVFYTTGFMLEIIVVALYQIFRFDLRFHIPDGSSGPGDYSGKKTLLGDAEKMGEEPNYQDVDVKMRMDIQTADDGIPERERATKEEVRQAIYNMRIQSEIVGQPIDSGDSELLIYAFRVQKPGTAPQRPARYTSPEDRNSMERRGYGTDVKGGLEEASEYGDSGVPSYYNPSIRTGLPRSPRPPPRNNAWKRASRGYWNMRQSLI